jgi:hypothetical protein
MLALGAVAGGSYARMAPNALFIPPPALRVGGAAGGRVT